MMTFDYLKKYLRYLTEYRKFIKLESREDMDARWKDRWPCLNDRVSETPFDAHYVYHLAWAARVVAEIKPEIHYDISSHIYFSTQISTFVKVHFVDLRPVNLKLSGLTCKEGDILNLPFDDETIDSLSSLSVIEHIGLGRYGDPMDLNGDIKAMKELQRVLAPGGNLLLAVPIGRSRVAFNAHRVYAHEHILDYFKELKLHQFSLIPDTAHKTGMINNPSPEIIAKQEYACGCYWFKKGLNK